MRLLEAQHRNVTSVHYKNSQIANGSGVDVAYSTLQRGAAWSPNSGSSDPVTAATGLSAGGSGSASCWLLVYAVASASVVVAALIIALVAILVRCRRNSASGSNSGNGAAQWNKKLAGILTPTTGNLLRQQPKSAAAPNPDAKSPSNALTSTILPALSSSKKAPVGGQRYGYTPLAGSIYPAAKGASAAPRRDPNPYGLPPSQCSYQPQRVRVVSLKRKRTIDSQTEDVDNEDEEQLSPSHQYTEIDNETPALNDLQALLPLASLRSLFGVVGGVFGVSASLGGPARQPVSVVDRRASCIAVERPRTPPGEHLAAILNNMGANASAEPTSGGADAAQSSQNNSEAFGSAGSLDNFHATSTATLASSTATQSATSGDLDVGPAAGFDDSVSSSTQSHRQSIAAEKCSVDDDVMSRRQSGQSSAGSTPLDATSRQTATTTLGRIGGLADALGLGDLVRSVTNSHPAETEKVEPFWVPPGLQIQKRRAQSLQSSLPLSQVNASSVNAKNGRI